MLYYISISPCLIFGTIKNTSRCSSNGLLRLHVFSTTSMRKKPYRTVYLSVSLYIDSMSLSPRRYKV